MTEPVKQLPSCPDGLSDASQALWPCIVKPGASVGRCRLIEEALRCLDRLAQVRGILATESLTVTTERTKAVHAHPLLKIETELRRQFASLWSALNLEWRADIDGYL